MLRELSGVLMLVLRRVRAKSSNTKCMRSERGFAYFVHQLFIHITNGFT